MQDWGQNKPVGQHRAVINYVKLDFYAGLSNTIRLLLLDYICDFYGFVT
jgi:hypothetical protein